MKCYRSFSEAPHNNQTTIHCSSHTPSILNTHSHLQSHTVYCPLSLACYHTLPHLTSLSHCHPYTSPSHPTSLHPLLTLVAFILLKTGASVSFAFFSLHPSLLMAYLHSLSGHTLNTLSGHDVTTLSHDVTTLSGHIHMHTPNTFTNTHAQTDAHMYTHTHTHTQTHTHTHTHARTHTHTHIHTYIYLPG